MLVFVHLRKKSTYARLDLIAYYANIDLSLNVRPFFRGAKLGH